MKLLTVLAVILPIASANDLGGAESNLTCAVPPAIKEGRIINGKTATNGQFPYQVGLELASAFYDSWCGGSLIGSEWVLTAAHCVDDDDISWVYVYLGSIFYKKSEVSYMVNSDAIIIHPGWDKKTWLIDIALIKIPSVTLSTTIQLIKLPARGSSYSSYAGEHVITSGWGRIRKNIRQHPKKLQYARTQVSEESLCEKHYPEFVAANHICVGTESGVSVCFGDSGGPLVLESDNVQIGVFSFLGDYGCIIGCPTGFARLTSYVDWIYSHTGIGY